MLLTMASFTPSRGLGVGEGTKGQSTDADLPSPARQFSAPLDCETPPRSVFRIPSEPSPPLMLATSLMQPRGMGEYSNLLRFGRQDGYLWRLYKGGPEEVWERKYFVLMDGHLFQYDSEAGARSAGLLSEISASSAAFTKATVGPASHSIAQLSELRKVGTSKTGATAEYADKCFQLLKQSDGSRHGDKGTASGDRIVLRAESRAERDNWMFTFHRSIAKIIAMILAANEWPGSGLVTGNARGAMRSSDGSFGGGAPKQGSRRVTRTLSPGKAERSLSGGDDGKFPSASARNISMTPPQISRKVTRIAVADADRNFVNSSSSSHDSSTPLDRGPRMLGASFRMPRMEDGGISPRLGYGVAPASPRAGAAGSESPRSTVSGRSSFSEGLPFELELDGGAPSAGAGAGAGAIQGHRAADAGRDGERGGARFGLGDCVEVEGESKGGRHEPSAFHIASSGAVDTSGIRDKMEDVWICENAVSLRDGTVASVYAVFDGHAGRQAAEFAREHIVEVLRGDERICGAPDPNSVRAAIVDAFLHVDREFLQLCDRDNLYAGTTAVLCLIIGHGLWVATLGDSKATLACSAVGGGVPETIEMSTVQTPGRADERERILKAGGWVTEEKEIFISRLRQMDLSDAMIREYAEKKVGMVSIFRVNGDISVSRAIGDPDYKKDHGLETFCFSFPRDHPRKFTGDLIIAEPEVLCRQMCGSEEFLIAASDGLWDVIDADLATLLVRNQRQAGRTAKAAAQELVDTAMKLGTSDNVSVIVVYLQE